MLLCDKLPDAQRVYVRGNHLFFCFVLFRYLFIIFFSSCQFLLYCLFVIVLVMVPETDENKQTLPRIRETLLRRAKESNKKISSGNFGAPQSSCVRIRQWFLFEITLEDHSLYLHAAGFPRMPNGQTEKIVLIFWMFIIWLRWFFICMSTNSGLSTELVTGERLLMIRHSLSFVSELGVLSKKKRIFTFTVWIAIIIICSKNSNNIIVIIYISMRKIFRSVTFLCDCWKRHIFI